MFSESPLPWQRILLQTMESWRAAGVTDLATVELTPVDEANLPVSASTSSIPTSSQEIVPEVSTVDLNESPVDAPDPPAIDQTEQGMPRKRSTEPVSELTGKTTSTGTVDSGSLELPILDRGAREDVLAKLAARVSKCVRCQELAETRTQTVFGVGNPEARIVFIGEAPGADEDAQGEPFVGRAGQLLNKIIEAMGLQREDLYICNVLRCRPPDNRTPAPQEAANCREYLDGQLSTIRPEYIVCWGSCAAQNLLGSTESIGKLRKRFFKYAGAKVLCTYHPSYLLRNPPAKKDVWEDMQLLMREAGIPLPPK